jgi:hypothetical protein
MNKFQSNKREHIMFPLNYRPQKAFIKVLKTKIIKKYPSFRNE